MARIFHGTSIGEEPSQITTLNVLGVPYRNVVRCDGLSPPASSFRSAGETSMLKALERNIASVDERIVLLAPSVASVANFFKNVDVDADRHGRLVADVQRFRGSIYLHDGAITHQDVSADGLHQTPEDDSGWHVLLLNKQQQITASALYLEHDNTIAAENLRVRHSPLAQQDEWRPKLWKAIKSELAVARNEHLRYVELG